MKRLKVLLIEGPQECVQSVIQESIRDLEVHYHTVNDVQQGLRELRQNSYDLIILDLNQRESSGIEGVQWLKAEFPELSVVVIAENHRPETVAEAIRSGAEDFLVQGSFGHQRLERLFRCASLKKAYFAKCFELQGRLRLATSVLPICMWISRDGVTISNLIGNAEGLFGEVSEAWAGRRIRELFGGLDDQIESDLEESIRRAEKGEASRYVFFHDGKWLESSIVGIEESGQMTYHGLITDVSEIKESELKFRQAKKEMERVHKSKMEFLESVSHDLRTPLNGIIGAAQLLRYRQHSKSHHALVQNVLSCSENLLSIIDDVLELKTIGLGNLEDIDRVFDLGRVIKSCCETIEPLVSDKGLELVVEQGLGLDGLKVRTSERALRRLLVNLLGNAVKFTDAGEIRVGLSVEEGDQGQMEIRGWVSDTGTGIAREVRESLFSAHHGGHPMASERSGTGLGLVICKRVLESLGGKIHVESQPGVGSSFSFSFPVEVVLRPLEAGSSQENYQLVPNSFHDCQRRVLVVDDLEENRFILSEMVRFFGFDCDAADGAEEAEELFQKNCYSDVFMDMRMPKIDGFGAVSRLRELEAGRKCPPSHIVAVTASNTVDFKNRCLKLGCDEFIPKPITMGRLKQYFVG